MLTTRAAELTRLRDQARAQMAELNQVIADLKLQFGALEQRSSSEIESLTDANQSLSEQLQTVSGQLQQMKDLLQQEQQQGRELAARFETQTRELLAKQVLLERLQSAQQALTQSNADASTEIDKLNELIRQRQAENAALQGVGG